MDTKKLRQKVLDLAIRGKLVPQNPNDEPASVLLKRIYAEKQKLISEGKIKREKRSSFIFKGEDNSYYEKVVENGKETIVNIDDEIPFDIPESWAWCRLGNVCNYINAGGDKPNNFSKKITRENNIPIYSNGLDNEGLYGYTNSPSIIDPAITISARGTIGVPFIRTTPFVHIIRLIAVVPLSHIDISYLYYVLSTRRLVSEGSSIPQLTVPSVLPYLFPLPPIEEQKRIVEAIENLTNKISSIDEEYSSIEEKISLAKSKLLDLAIRGKLLAQDENDEPASKLLERIRKEKESAQLTSKSKRKTAVSYIFKGEDNLYYEKIGSETKCIQDEIPLNWAWCRLLEICKVYQPKTISTRQMVVVGEFVVFGANGIIGRYNEYNHKEAEVLITCRGATCGAINVSLPFSWINGNAMVISPLYENIPSKSFLELYLKGINMNEYITGTAQPQITREELSKMKLPIPPLEEQKRIVEYISKANNQLDSMLSE